MNKEQILKAFALYFGCKYKYMGAHFSPTSGKKEMNGLLLADFEDNHDFSVRDFKLILRTIHQITSEEKIVLAELDKSVEKFVLDMKLKKWNMAADSLKK